ncbi:alpha/beta fold hydrolase [Mycobacterium noviomagense]|uniref:alpha/beta fold hydrolase n=1 Tax=Mycobacterium noviomagense TaxID=459858 RepID=UPI0021F27258|nr:alpha/beta hydrolase [Mycobacterium noviomagense]
MLVHGGFDSGRRWIPVATLLRQVGHRVYTPTLLGIGERAHLASSETGLYAQVQDVIELFHTNDLRDVILVGHSYGGMVITAIAGEIPDRIAHLIYLDAMAPHDGEAVADIIPRLVNRMRKQAVAHGDGWWLPAGAWLPHLGKIVSRVIGFFEGHHEDPADQNVTGAPLRMFEEPIHMTHPDLMSSIPRTYIVCTGGTLVGQLLMTGFRSALHPRLRPPRGPNWRHRRLPTTHRAMITMPHEVARLLLEPATGEPQLR